MTKENQIEENLIEQLEGLKYIYRPDIVDRKTLEQNFKNKFEALNRVRLSERESQTDRVFPYPGAYRLSAYCSLMLTVLQ